MMSDITFDKERKGYSIGQVDEYIAMLQNHYKEVGAKAEGQRILLEELKSQSERRRSKEEQTQQLIQNGKTKFHDIEEEIQVTENEWNRLKLASDNLELEILAINESITALTQQKESLPEPVKEVDGQDLENEILALEELLLKSKDSSMTHLQEQEALTETIQELSGQIELLEQQIGDHISVESMDGFAKLQSIFIAAKQKVDLHVEEIRQKTVLEVVDINQNAQAHIEMAQIEATKISEELKRCRLKGVEAEKEKLMADIELFQKEKNDFVEQCNQIRSASEQVKKEAVQKAEEIIAQTKMSMEAAQRKEKEVINQVMQMLSDKKTAITREYEIVESQLRATAVEISGIMNEIKVD